jgi:hypothetical protein
MIEGGLHPHALSKLNGFVYVSGLDAFAKPCFYAFYLVMHLPLAAVLTPNYTNEFGLDNDSL